MIKRLEIKQIKETFYVLDSIKAKQLLYGIKDNLSDIYDSVDANGDFNMEMWDKTKRVMRNIEKCVERF